MLGNCTREASESPEEGEEASHDYLPTSWKASPPHLLPRPP